MFIYNVLLIFICILLISHWFTRFTKYGIDLHTLTLRLDDFTFATTTRGSNKLSLGYTDNCSGCGGWTNTRSRIYFDITGEV